MREDHFIKALLTAPFCVTDYIRKVSIKILKQKHVRQQCILGYHEHDGHYIRNEKNLLKTTSDLL